MESDGVEPPHTGLQPVALPPELTFHEFATIQPSEKPYDTKPTRMNVYPGFYR